MNDVYLLQHVREDDDEHSKIIGIYRTNEDAEAAIERLRDQPGFRDYPKGFQIDRYQLDEDNWIDGFADL